MSYRCTLLKYADHLDDVNMNIMKVQVHYVVGSRKIRKQHRRRLQGHLSIPSMLTCFRVIEIFRWGRTIGWRHRG